MRLSLRLRMLPDLCPTRSKQAQHPARPILAHPRPLSNPKTRPHQRQRQQKTNPFPPITKTQHPLTPGHKFFHPRRRRPSNPPNRPKPHHRNRRPRLSRPNFHPKLAIPTHRAPTKLPLPLQLAASFHDRGIKHHSSQLGFFWFLTGSIDGGECRGIGAFR